MSSNKTCQGIDPGCLNSHPLAVYPQAAYHVFDEEVGGAVDVDGAVEAVEDGETADIGGAHVAVEVRVHRVAAQAEGLSGVRHLHVAQT